MIFESHDGIDEYLRSVRNLEECVLLDVRWRHFGTVIELVFDFAWTSDGTVRRETEPPDVRTLVLNGVLELHVMNDLTEQMYLHPEQMNWGMSEVAFVDVVNDESTLNKYKSVPIPLHCIRCAWEGKRRVDIVFSTLQVR